MATNSSGGFAGFIFGLALVSPIARVILGLLMMVPFVLLMWDILITESTLPEDSADVRWEITSYREIGAVQPTKSFKMEGTMENRGEQTIDHFEIVADLLECQSPADLDRECRILDSTTERVNAQVDPGAFNHFVHDITFRQGQSEWPILRVKSHIENIVVDSDNEFE